MTATCAVGRGRLRQTEHIWRCQRVDGPVIPSDCTPPLIDYDLSWTPELATSQNAGERPQTNAHGPSLFTALQEQLGLKLESTRGPVEVLVIDHVDKPTPD